VSRQQRAAGSARCVCGDGSRRGTRPLRRQMGCSRRGVNVRCSAVRGAGDECICAWLSSAWRWRLCAITGKNRTQGRSSTDTGTCTCTRRVAEVWPQHMAFYRHACMPGHAARSSQARVVSQWHCMHFLRRSTSPPAPRYTRSCKMVSLCSSCVRRDDTLQGPEPASFIALVRIGALPHGERLGAC
jgi:hypothetical protein